MGADFSLDEHLRRHIGYPDPWLRLQGMETARQAVKEQLRYLKAQMGVQLLARIKRQGPNVSPDDVEDTVQKYRDEVDALFPKVLRGGYVISLWALFESCVKNIAEYTRKQRNLPFGLQELRAGDFLKQTETFFLKVLAVEAFPDKPIRKRLHELKDLRNTLAHHDGSVLELPDPLRGLEKAEYSARGLLVYRDLHHEFVVPMEGYAEAATALVEEYLRGFAERAYKAIHPIPLTE